ncbi:MULTISPECIES: ATP-dependent DNA helicase [unclassified Mycoplasma]
MLKQNFIVTGTFEKVLWRSRDQRTAIVAFKVLENDKKNPIILNSYNSITITFYDHLFDELKIEIHEKKYEISVIKNNLSKYNDSYLIDSQIPFKKVTSELLIEEKNEYLSQVFKLELFNELKNVKFNTLIRDLGEDVFQKIYDDKKLYGQTFGITAEDWKRLVEIIKNNFQYLIDISHLFKINVSKATSRLILKKFSSLKSFLDEYFDNLYDFYFDLEEYENIKISDIDKIAIEFNPTSLVQKNATYLYAFVEEYFFNSGNTRIKVDKFYKTLCNIFNNEIFNSIKKHFDETVAQLLEKRLLISLKYIDGEYYTTRDTIYKEEYVVKRLSYILKKSNYEEPNILNIPSIFDAQQVTAIRSALTENLVLITGNPGTGKTLITNEIIDQLAKKYDHNDIAILTPTGRATININIKQENMKAQTIHSFLRWDQESNRFFTNEDSTSDISILIIDEFSMVSLDLFYNLLKGISKYTLTKIILVGDKDQLPAIGSGYLIKDFIENNIFKTIILTNIYRQSGNFDIVKDALKINEGVFPDFESKNSEFYPTNRLELKNKLIKKIEELLAQGYTKKDIAILSPIYRYETGIDEVNEALISYFRNKEKPEVAKYRERTLAINDKIINLVNDSKLKVFNGEIGYISKFIYAKSTTKKEPILSHISIEFDSDDKVVTLPRAYFFENTYSAYCTSVHKYQGSECKAVIVILFSEAKKLLSKKLIYTAITRAKQYSVIIGEKSALEFGIANDDDSKRITNIQYLWMKNHK